MFWRIKTNFYRPTTIPVLQFYVKELLWNEKSREHRRVKSNCVWCTECFQRARWRRRRVRCRGLFQDDLIRGTLSTPGGGEICLWWDKYGSWRRRRSLIRTTWSEAYCSTPGGGEIRLWWDEYGHGDATESKRPDQDDLDQGYIELLQEEKGTFALQELGLKCHE